MTFEGSMITLNLHKAKTHLSRPLEDLEHGKILILCPRNRPHANLATTQMCTPADQDRMAAVVNTLLGVQP
jgi:antitoxin (DNA-binding transcriptional repressor) of toxin-antitoxin stability system